jgi:hypothetical protein
MTPPPFGSEKGLKCVRYRRPDIQIYKIFGRQTDKIVKRHYQIWLASRLRSGHQLGHHSGLSGVGNQALCLCPRSAGYDTQPAQPTSAKQVDD